MKFDPVRGLVDEGGLICPFKPVVTQVINEISDSNSPKRKYSVKICYLDGSTSPSVEVDSLNKIDFFEAFGIVDAQYTKSDRRKIIAYLQSQCSAASVTNRRCISSTGMVAKDPETYVFDKKTIISKEDNLVLLDEVLPEFVDEDYSEQEIIEYLDRLIQFMPGVSDVLLLSEILAKLKPVFELAGMKVDCFTVVYGFPGTFKTELSKLVCVADERQVQSFVDINKKKLKETIQMFGGHTIIVDDYHARCSVYQREKQKEILDHLARYGGFGGGAYIVATSEYLEGTYSLQDRMIPVRTRQIQSDKRAECLIELSWLRENKARLWVFYRQLCQAVYNDLRSVEKYIKAELSGRDYKTTFRIERNTQYLEVAYNVFLKWYFKANNKAWETQLHESLNNLQNNAFSTMQKVQRLQYGVDWAYEVRRIMPPITLEDTFDQLGFYYNDGFWYVLPYKLEQLLAEALEVKISMRDVVNDLISKGILYKDASKGNTVKRKDRKGVYALSVTNLNRYAKENLKIKRNEG